MMPNVEGRNQKMGIQIVIKLIGLVTIVEKEDGQWRRTMDSGGGGRTVDSEGFVRDRGPMTQAWKWWKGRGLSCTLAAAVNTTLETRQEHSTLHVHGGWRKLRDFAVPALQGFYKAGGGGATVRVPSTAPSVCFPLAFPSYSRKACGSIVGGLQKGPAATPPDIGTSGATRFLCNHVLAAWPAPAAPAYTWAVESPRL